jgi:transglutaminase-like putative cysteine protease
MTFERAFRLYSYLLLLAGFFALFASGAVSPLLAGLYLLAVILIARFGKLALPYTVQLLLILGLIGWFVVEVSLYSPVIEALVHLLLLMSLLRLLSASSGRDYLLLYLISFVFVLLASTYTISAFFLVTLVVYVFFSIQAFMLFETRAAYQETRHVSFSHKAYLQMSLTVTLLIMLLAIPIFVVIPRGGVSFLRTRSDSLAQMTGFSDRVVLGDLGRILSDARIVMRVKTDKPVEMLPGDLKWRGIALDHYDGRVWLNSRRREQQIYQNQLYRSFIVPRARRQQETQLRQTFVVEPFTNIVFGAPDIISISAFGNPGAYIVEDGNNSFTYLPSRIQRVTYVVYSDIVRRGQRLAAAQGASGTPPGMEAYLQLPAVDPRIRTLAQQITQNSPNPLARALAIERFLNQNYKYSLENEPGSAADPLADFLFVHKAGHCEYFAAAQAVMLRTIGIPCRVVNGFRRGEYNGWSEHFIVRQSDAHSWVEAYFEGGGWIEFDPTPAASPDDRFYMRLSSEWLDALDAFWTEVVTFDRIGQVTLFQSTGRELFRFFTGTRHLLGRLRGLREALKDEFLAARLLDIAVLFWVLPGVVVVFAVAYRYRRYLRLFVKRKVLRQGADRLAPEYYLELLEVLKRRGFRRARSETPQEFANRVRVDLGSKIPQRVTELYYGNRFGSVSLEASDLSEIYDGLRQLRKRH